jgi:hypothetical protein
MDRRPYILVVALYASYKGCVESIRLMSKCLKTCDLHFALSVGCHIHAVCCLQFIMWPLLYSSSHF